MKLLYFSPMMALDLAASLLNLDRSATRLLVEDGTLAPAFDIGIGKRDYMLSVLAASVAHYQKKKTRQPYPHDLTQILIQYWPNSQTITTGSLYFDLCCSNDHIGKLVHRKLLSLVPGQRMCRGRPPARIAPWSVRSFLRKRLFTG